MTVEVQNDGPWDIRKACRMAVGAVLCIIEKFVYLWAFKSKDNIFKGRMPTFRPTLDSASRHFTHLLGAWMGIKTLNYEETFTFSFCGSRRTVCLVML